MSELRYPQALLGHLNKHEKKLDLYHGRPFVWYDTGYDYNRYKQVRQPWLMIGRVIWYHKDMIAVLWENMCIPQAKPSIGVYNEFDFHHRLPISYGYSEGDKVVRVTDGKIHKMGHINWNAHDFYCKPAHEKNGRWTYSLYRPHEDDRSAEFDPMEVGEWEGIFKI